MVGAWVRLIRVMGLGSLGERVVQGSLLVGGHFAGL